MTHLAFDMLWSKPKKPSDNPKRSIVVGRDRPSPFAWPWRNLSSTRQHFVHSLFCLLLPPSFVFVSSGGDVIVNSRNLCVWLPSSAQSFNFSGPSAEINFCMSSIIHFYVAFFLLLRPWTTPTHNENVYSEFKASAVRVSSLPIKRDFFMWFQCHLSRQSLLFAS